MVLNYLSFFISILRSSFTSMIFIIPLGFICLTGVVSLFRRLGG